jgi:hypothetical protein
MLAGKATTNNFVTNGPQTLSRRLTASTPAQLADIAAADPSSQAAAIDVAAPLTVG